MYPLAKYVTDLVLGMEPLILIQDDPINYLMGSNLLSVVTYMQ